MPKQLSEREIKYWLTRYTPRSSCWIVYTEIERMTSHDGTKLTYIGKNTNFSSKNVNAAFVPKTDLSYVYTALMTEKRLLTIFETCNGFFYLLDNRKIPLDADPDLFKDEEKEQTQGTQEKGADEPRDKPEDASKDKETDHKRPKQPAKKEVETKTVSSVIVADNLPSLIAVIPNNVLKVLKLLRVHKMTLTKDDYLRLERTVGFDFANSLLGKSLGKTEFKESSSLLGKTELTLEEREAGLLKLFRKFLKEIKSMKEPKAQKNLDFSGNMTIYPAILEKLGFDETSHIEEMVFFQNIRIGKWSFLTQFANLHTISLWYMYQLKDDDIITICRSAPKLQAINVHQCYQISNRAIVPILSLLKEVERVALDNKVLICQKNAYQGVATEKEWSCIKSTSLKYLLLNSDNLTQDVIDSYLKACPNLQRFIMNTLVLKRLRQNVSEGVGPETITFQASEDLRLGFTVKKDIKIANLLKDRYEPSYSASMLQVIKQQKLGEYEEEENEEELEEIIKELEQPVF
jgi:hypothetical protein